MNRSVSAAVTSRLTCSALHRSSVMYTCARRSLHSDIPPSGQVPVPCIVCLTGCRWTPRAGKTQYSCQRRFLENLRYVVVDEGHMYKGAFGCHVACVLRRLRRVCERQYGSSPTFVVTSATSADPARHVADLLGVDDVLVVDRDGSPHGPRVFALWNPPLTRGGAGLPESAKDDGKGGGDDAVGGGDGGRAGENWSRTEGRARGRQSKRVKADATREALRARNLARSGVLHLLKVSQSFFICYDQRSQH